jgi:predicted acyltransferase
MVAFVPMTAPAGRLAALDIFRGATIASMILVNNPGSWQHVYAPLRHAEWHGWTFTDTVFPFFLWIVGVSLTLSVARRVEKGQSKSDLFGHAVRRALILFAIGFLLSAAPSFNFATIRIPGVLQRIAVCYLLATAIFLWTSVRGQAIAIVVINALYWIPMMTASVPGCATGSLEKICNFAQYMDSLALSGHMWSQTKTWDPEGLWSTLPAITTVLFGIMAGHLLRWSEAPRTRLKWLLSGGLALMLVGLILDHWMPINKNLWTSSYAVFMAGLASMCLGCWYWIADIQGWRRWLKPFEIYGMNAIAMFILSGIIAKWMGRSGMGGSLYDALCAIASPINASLFYAILNVAACYAVAWVMYRRGWFVRF